MSETVKDQQEQYVNLDKTIPFMQHRKSVRRYRGAYTATRFGPTWGLFICLVFLWGLRMIDYDNNRIRFVFEWAGPQEGVAWLAAGIIFMFIILYFLVQHQVYYNIVESFYMTIAANILMLISVIATWEVIECEDIVNNKDMEKENKDVYIPRSTIIFLYIIASIAVFIIKYFQRRILPGWYKRDYLICRMSIKEQKNQQLFGDREVGRLKNYFEQEAVRSIQIKYVNPISRLLLGDCQRPHRIQYIGMTDEQGRPHGFGIWKDSQWHGEHLIGKWTHGIPMGPFKSRETGSGSGFITIRIPYFQCRGDKVTSFGYRIKPAPVTVGIANAECSISGIFFKDYPRITWMQGPTLYDNPEKLMYTEEYQFILSNQKKSRQKVQNRSSQYNDVENPQTEEDITGNEQQTKWQKLRNMLFKQEVETSPEQVDKENVKPSMENLIVQKQQQNVLSRMVTSIRQSLQQKKDTTCHINWLLEGEMDSFKNIYTFSGAYQSLTGKQSLNTVTINLDNENRISVSGYAPRNSQISECEELKVIVKTKGNGLEINDVQSHRIEEIDEENKQDQPSSASTQTIKIKADDNVEVEQENADPPERPSFARNAKMIMELSTSLLPTGREISPVYKPKNENSETNLQQESQKTQSSQARLEILGWQPREYWKSSEAIIFVHGYNCSVEHGMKLFAQLLALGNFPPFMRPICFGWPNTKDVTYYQSQRKGAEAQFTHESLLQLLHGLGREGIDSVHIMGHSMGGRVVMSSVPLLVEAVKGYNALENTPFQKPQGYVAKYKSPTVRIQSCTLLNPEYGLGDFVNHTGPLLRKICPLVTIYGDKQDQALGMSETLNGLRRWWTKKEKLPVATPSFLEGVPGVQTNKDACISCCPCFDMMDESVGHALDYVVNPTTGDPLDVDVIDTTFLESNIHSIRHNYFHVNKEVVEDLRELMVTKRRASQRTSRLENTHGNVYGFLVAPSYVAAK